MPERQTPVRRTVTGHQLRFSRPQDLSINLRRVRCCGPPITVYAFSITALSIFLRHSRMLLFSHGRQKDDATRHYSAYTSPSFDLDRIIQPFKRGKPCFHALDLHRYSGVDGSFHRVAVPRRDAKDPASSSLSLYKIVNTASGLAEGLESHRQSMTRTRELAGEGVFDRSCSSVVFSKDEPNLSASPTRGWRDRRV